MAVCFLADKNLELFFDYLRNDGQLHAPLSGEDGVLRFAPLKPGTLPNLSACRTLLPAKKYLLHPQETVLEYTAENGYQLPYNESPPLILFGLHPCDLAGISYLDRVFLGNDPDPLYAARRTALTLIGLSCTPDKFCSCQKSPSTLPVPSDLFINITTDGFILSSGSLRGAEILKRAKGLFEERKVDLPDDTRRFFDQNVSELTLPEIDPTLPNWQEFASRCLGCGACSLCCPTCYCFDVLESGALDGCSAKRLRQWDNCLFKSHSQIAGGISFNKDRAARFRYRYRHKYLGFGALTGVGSCVGCGRCLVVCPAEIDLRPLAERVEGAVHE